MQTPENNRDREDQALEAPPKLVAALKGSVETTIFIPPTVDEAVMRAARRQLQRRKEPGLGWSWMLPWAAAAAALVLLVAVVPRWLRKPAAAPNPGYALGVMNNDGQGDILDAFALARELKAGAHPDGRWDVNGDGVVDERDVALLAARAVSLEKGRHS